ncbi:hypothetical protein ASE08_26650 [Rhizobacter sp. Root16D2]|nr:hypothetical protein ASC88_17400 [Rhizobacter sp. Root29]KQW13898.1 hypothetical protein ASC98_17530 [Rhizobacter sp. Root1238]KRB15722.1 hypothetical protein ASE08_26650 [Rhizobacter sp. Root16D2]
MLAAVAVHGTAHAATGSVEFTLDGLPSLASDAAAADASGAAGYWITDNRYSSRMALIRDWQGSAPALVASYQSTDAGAAGLAGAPFGEAQGRLAWAPDLEMSAGSHFHEGSLGMSWQGVSTSDLSLASLNWGRSFALNPHSSVTLAGTLSYTYSGGPLEARYESHLTPVMWGNELGVASLHFDRRETDETPGDNHSMFDFDLLGTIHYDDPRNGTRGHGGQFTANDIAYSVDSFGHLSMTIFNHSSKVLFGSFDIGSSISSLPISAVPEPSVWMAMLLGAGLIGLRRRSGEADLLTTRSS